MNENLNEVAETLSPAEMFLNDLNANDVSSELVDDASVNEEIADAIEDAVEETQESEEMPTNEDEEPSYASKEDMSNMKNELISKIAELANKARAEENAMPKEEVKEPIKEEPVDEQALLDKYYENPLKAINEIADKKAEAIVQSKLNEIKSELEPLIRQSEDAKYKESVKNVLTNFVNGKSDAKDYLDDMVKYINSNNLAKDNEDSYEKAYLNSKLARQDGLINQLKSSQGKSLNDYLNDDSSLSEILNNDNIKAKIIENYLKELQNGAKPATISGGGTTSPTAQAVNAPSSFNEASRLFASDLNR